MRMPHQITGLSTCAEVSSGLPQSPCLTVRMPEKACEATEDMRPRASELLRSTAFVCCLYSDAVHAVPTTTPACAGQGAVKTKLPSLYLTARGRCHRCQSTWLMCKS
jgi:hypothetical protein